MSGPAYNPYGEESYAMHMHSDMGVDPSVAGNSGAGAGANINYEHGHAGDENIEHGGNTMEFDEDEDLDGNYEEQDDFDGHDRSHAMLSEVGVGADVQHAEHGSAPQPLHPSSTAAPPELGMRVGEGNLQGQAQLQQGHQYQAPLPQAQQGQAQEQQGQQENSSGDYSLYNNPPNLRRIREILFELKEPAEISLEEFETYWPFVDNVWVKQRSNSTKDGLMTTDYYMCRLRRPTCRGAPSESSSPDVQRHPEEQRQRNRLRNKKRREGCACNVQIKVVKFEGVYTTVTISKTPGSDKSHSHDLQYIDKVKRNSGLLKYVKNEAKKGYLPSSIYAKLYEEMDPLWDAGGKYLSITDVRNVAAKWRSIYPTESLKVHEGYRYQQGWGIRRIVECPTSNKTRRKMLGGPVPGLTPSESPPPPPQLPPDALQFPDYDISFLEPYLPKHDERHAFPQVTLSYACSMDAKISLKPGVMTLISGPESKLMTHYLRSRHDAIVIGIGTALADDPGLNCRLDGAGGYGGLGRMWQPRPIIIDPTGRWPADPNCKLLQTAKSGKGKAPWIVISPGANVPPEKVMLLKSHGGDYLRIVEYNQNWLLRWEAIFRALAAEGIRSVMVEGGGTVMSELLNPEYREFVDSVIVTIAPTYLGNGGVSVSPDSKKDETGKPVNALSPTQVKWTPLGQDVVMCGKVKMPEPIVVSSSPSGSPSVPEA